MTQSMPVLVAPAAVGGLRAPVVAAAIGRGLEHAGLRSSSKPVPPDLCPVAGGGRGTIEVLLPALSGETGDGFALIEGGGTALVELAATGRATGAAVAAAIDGGAEVVLIAAGAGGEVDDDGGEVDGGATLDEARDVIEAIEDGGGPRGAALVVLCETRAAWTGRACGGGLRRDPGGVAMTAAGGGLAGALWARYDARLVAAVAFVLEQLDFDARMRAARAVVVGETRLDRGTLAGRVAGEIAVRARQAGVPCHAVAARNALDPFDVRILDLQAIVEARTIPELEAAGAQLAEFL